MIYALERIKDLTDKGILEWQKVSSDRFKAEAGSLTFELTYEIIAGEGETDIKLVVRKKNVSPPLSELRCNWPSSIHDRLSGLLGSIRSPKTDDERCILDALRPLEARYIKWLETNYS